MPDGIGAMSEEHPRHLNERFAFGRPVVMLVDDDDLLRRSTGRFLTRVGFDVVTAASAADALEMLDGGATVDVFVVDLEMPGMNGVELLRRLSEREPCVVRGLWSASPDLQHLGHDDLELAWFVMNKARPIGELVQAIARAVYGRFRTAPGFDEGCDGANQPSERQKARSGWVRRQGVLEEIDDVNRGSSSR